MPPRSTLTVTVNFTHDDGDIDLDLFRACGTDPVAVSHTAADIETVTYSKTGATAATVVWKVFLADDVRNTYDLTVSFQ